ncbi:MAG: SDR family NAD(P)-dependent oxidoreductase [Candidatus Binatia bacterium]
MDPFKGRVAVVTGGASGLGAEMGRTFARLGAKIVLADLDEAGMKEVAAEIGREGGEAIAVTTDVTMLDHVRRLADEAWKRFGAAHIVCNNAGVGTFGPLATATHNDWKWVTDVNYWGVVHGVEVFLPRLLEQNQGGHIVNTASMAGLAGMPGLGVYCATKFAVVGLTESLHRELAGTGIGASVLCPMIVRTRINEAERTRPTALRNPQAGASPELSDAHYTFARVIEPPEVAERVVRAIRENSPYILTHRESRDILRRRAERLMKAAEDFATA